MENSSLFKFAGILILALVGYTVYRTEVASREIAELKEQFADDKKEEAPPLPPNPVSLFADVAKWPDLAMEWMKRIV